MHTSVAVKLASYLGHVAAEARIKRALVEAGNNLKTSMPTSAALAILTGSSLEKTANPDKSRSFFPDINLQDTFDKNPLLTGGVGGAALGALAGGGSTAVANMFRKKRDRQSILNNALLGAAGAGSLGLAAGAGYKAFNAGSDIDKKTVTDADVAAAKQKILNDPKNKQRREAYERAKDPLGATIKDYTGLEGAGDLTRTGLSVLGGTAGYRAGQKFIDNPRLLKSFVNSTNPSVTRDELQRIAGPGASLRDLQRVAGDVGRKGSTLLPVIGGWQASFRQNPQTPGAARGNPTLYDPKSVLNAAKQEAGWFRPRAGGIVLGALGAAAPYAADYGNYLITGNSAYTANKKTIDDINAEAEQLAAQMKQRPSR